MTGVTIGGHELTYDGGQEEFGREAVAGGDRGDIEKSGKGKIKEPPG